MKELLGQMFDGMEVDDDTKAKVKAAFDSYLNGNNQAAIVLEHWEAIADVVEELLCNDSIVGERNQAVKRNNPEQWAIGFAVFKTKVEQVKRLQATACRALPVFILLGSLYMLAMIRAAIQTYMSMVVCPLGLYNMGAGCVSRLG